MRENRPYGSEGGEGEHPSRPLSTESLRPNERDISNPNNFAPEGASRCRAVASGLWDRLARESRLFARARGTYGRDRWESRTSAEWPAEVISRPTTLGRAS